MHTCIVVNIFYTISLDKLNIMITGKKVPKHKGKKQVLTQVYNKTEYTIKVREY